MINNYESLHYSSVNRVKKQVILEICLFLQIS